MFAPSRSVALLARLAALPVGEALVPVVVDLFTARAVKRRRSQRGRRRRVLFDQSSDHVRPPRLNLAEQLLINDELST